MVLVPEFVCAQALINFNEAVVVVAVVTVIVVVRVKCRLVLLLADLELTVDSRKTVTINTLYCLSICLQIRLAKLERSSGIVSRAFWSSVCSKKKLPEIR